MSCYKIEVLKLFLPNIWGIVSVYLLSKYSKWLRCVFGPQYLLEYQFFIIFTMILIAIVLLTIIRLSWVHGLVMYNMCYTIHIHVFHNSFVTRIERELVVYRRRCPHQSEQFVQPPYIALPPSSCSLACLTLLFYIMCYNFQRFKVSPPSSWGSPCGLLSLDMFVLVALLDTFVQEGNAFSPFLFMYHVVYSCAWKLHRKVTWYTWYSLC